MTTLAYIAVALFALRLCLRNLSPEHRAARTIGGLLLSVGFMALALERIAARFGRPLTLPNLDAWLPLGGELLGAGLLAVAVWAVASWCVEWLSLVCARQPNEGSTAAKLRAMPPMPTPSLPLSANDREVDEPLIATLPETPEPLAVDNPPAAVRPKGGTVSYEAYCVGSSPKAVCCRLNGYGIGSGSPAL